MPSLLTENASKALERAYYEFVNEPRKGWVITDFLSQNACAGTILGLDTETTGLDPLRDRVRLIQLGSKDSALIVDLNAWRTGGERQVDWEAHGLRELKEYIEGPQPKILQNAAFDLNFLLGEGACVGGALFDTMIASKVYYNGQSQNKNDLGSIVQRALHYDLPKELQRADWSGEISGEMLHYAARDVICLPWLKAPLSEQLKKAPTKEGCSLWDVFLLELQALRPIALMQWHGFAFDREAAEELKEQLVHEAETLRIKFTEHLDQKIREKNPDNPHIWLPRNEDGSFNTNEKEKGSIRLGTKIYAGFNARSNQQMAKRFVQAGVLLPVDSTGKPSLDQNLLAEVRGYVDLVDEYLTWKTADTRVSSIEQLLNAVGPDGRIHCNYRQMGTDTGRLSAASPNLQQVNRSKEFRSKFIAQKGYSLVVADFSQVELRIAAMLSEEAVMIDAYVNERELHTETAMLLTGKKDAAEVTKAERTSAKISNFGLLYGAGPATLRKQAIAQYGVAMTHEEAKEIVDGFRKGYPTLYQWQQYEGGGQSKFVTTALGRRRFLQGFNDKYTTRINTQVQGTAGDISKSAIALLWQAIKQAPEDEARLIAMVHDELVLEVREGFEEKWMQILQNAMEEAGNAISPTVPIVAEASSGKTWADAK